MANRPNHRKRSRNKKRNANNQFIAISGPPTAAIPQTPPSDHHPEYTKYKFQWTNDPGMFGVTIVLAICAVITVGVLFLQACILNRTDETARISNRSRIYFDKVGINVVNLGKETVVGMTLSITNSGNIPPRNLRFATDCPRQISSEKETDPFTLFKRDMSKAIPENIGPKQIVHLGVCTLRSKDVLEVQNGIARRYMTAEAQYEDKLIPNTTLITRFSVGLYFSNFVDTEHPFNWNTESRGRNNCSDEDCEEADRDMTKGFILYPMTTRTVSPTTVPFEQLMTRPKP